MLPMFKKSHINTRAIEDYISKGIVRNYSEEPNKRNALKQASFLYKMVDGALYRHGSSREYAKFGLRVVIHDDEPQRKLDIISKYHMDDSGNHYGMNNTIKSVNKLYYWHGLSSHVKMFLKKCTHCKERSKFSMEEWLEEEKKTLTRKRMAHVQSVQMSAEIRHEIKSLGRIRKSTPPETFFIVNAERKVDLDNFNENAEMLIDSNNIEFVVETLGNCEDGKELKEVCHVLNVQDIVPLPERYRSREIENFLKYGSYPEDFTSNQKSGLRGPAVQYCIVDDELHHNSSKKTNSGPKLVIHDDNPALKVKIMVESHLDEDGNHLGLNRTMSKVAEKYFWLGLSLDIRKFMMKCKICSQNRGKRLNEDTSRFTEEVKKLKQKQYYQETGTPVDEVLTTYTVNSDGTLNETIEHENYNQVYRLVGNEEDNAYRLVGNDEDDVNEITVKVVNGEIVQTLQQEEAPEGLELVEAQLVEISPGQGETVGDTDLIEVNDQTESKDAQNEEYKDENNEEQEDGSEESESLTIVTGICDNVQAHDNATEMIEQEDRPNNELKENKDKESDDKVAVDEVSVETAIEMLVNNESIDTSGANDSEQMEVVPSNSTPGKTENLTQTTTACQLSKVDSFYEDCIFVPKSKKTRAIERFLLSRTVTIGYTTSKLRELAQNFILEGVVLYRRASRYKGKQIIIHDDQPEIKLKILHEHHRKPNGDHCSELVTCANVQYKFYWEEVRWDVNRFYHRCKVCVDNGIEIKTKKKVLSMKELKVREMEQRKKVTEEGLNAKRNRNFREEHKQKFDTFKKWSRYGKPFYEMEAEDESDLTEGDETNAAGGHDEGAPMEDDESDIEINLEEDEEETRVNEMVMLTVYSTQDQEQQIREMFQEKGWEYKLQSMSRCVDQNPDTSDDLYEMVMMTTLEQDQAIQELFKSVNTAVDITEEESHEQKLAKEEKDKPNESKPIAKTKTEPTQTSVKKKTPAKDKPKIIDKDVKMEKDKGSKRIAEEIHESPSESRRPRREIKRPRRFSPDRMEEEQKNMSPKKTPKGTTKSKEQNSKQIPKNEDKKISKLISSPQKRKRLAKTIDSDKDNEAPEKSSTKKNPLERTPAKSTELPVRPTRSGRKSSKQAVDSCSSKRNEVEEAKSKNVKNAIKSSPRIKQENKGKDNELKQSKNKKSAEVKETLEDERNSGSDIDEDPDLSLEENSSELLELDDDYEAFSDEEEDDFDGKTDKSENNSALEVLMTDKEFEMEVVNVDGLYMCSLCDAEFDNKQECKVHGLQNNCNVNCKICGRMFRKNEKVELQKHESLHDSSQKFPCTSCDKVFTNSKSLDIHSRCHTNMREEKCRQCVEKFFTSFQVASHMYRVHGESNMFNCDICKAKFVNLNFMKSEVLFDGVLSYFKCVMCDK